MHKSLFISLFVFVALQRVSAQNTEADMQKKLQRAQAEIDKMMNDPKMKGLAKKMPNMDSLSKNLSPVAKTAISKTDSRSALLKSFPARNDKLLATIPKKTLTRQELISFLSALHSQLENKLPAGKVAAAKETVLNLNKDPMNISMAGSIAWYKSAPAEAALLLTYAAAASPDDNILNNCGAVLNLCGLEEKAIPVLKYALAHQPTNSTLLNNIGQAYAGLGALDTAIYYLRACIGKSSTHPEACGTVAYIEAQRGRNDEAIHMAEQAIKGGYSAAIATFYKKLKKDASMLPLLEDNLDPTEKYFDMADWNIPPLCRSWQQSQDIYPRQQAFLKKIDALCKGFENEAKGDAAPVFKNTRDILVWSMSQEISVGPLHDVAQALEDGFVDFYEEAAQKAYTDWLTKFTSTIMGEGNEAIAIGKKYGTLFKSAEKNPKLTEQLIVQECMERTALKDRYLTARADITEKYKNDQFSEDIKFYNNMVFLTRFTAPNEKTYKSVCALYATQMLNKFRIYAGGQGNVCNPAQKPNCGDFDPAKEYNNGDPKFTDANCPVDLKISFGVGKFLINCSRYELEVGEGIILNVEKDFVSGESTVAIGIGIATFIPGIPGTDLSPAEAEMKEQLYIKFDKKNQPTDIGMKWETELDVKFLPAEIKTGYTIGINSGYNFNEGPLKGILNPNPLTQKK